MLAALWCQASAWCRTLLRLPTRLALGLLRAIGADGGRESASLRGEGEGEDSVALLDRPQHRGPAARREARAASTYSGGAGPSSQPEEGLCHAGPEVHLVDGHLVSGRGTAMGGSAITLSMSRLTYWEVTLVRLAEGGSARVGAANGTHDRRAPLSCPEREPKAAATSWGHELADGEVREGDVLGVALSLDMFSMPLNATLSVLLRGTEIARLDGLRGDHYFPAVSVTPGAELYVNLSCERTSMRGPVPEGFALLLEDVV
ncbi:hypothetical protein T492DRAFT_1086459, partial [Pavlovales sp. CCMP2436]